MTSIREKKKEETSSNGNSNETIEKKRKLEIEFTKSNFEWDISEISTDWIKILENGYLKISKDYLKESGLKETDVILYPREELKNEWNFINDQVIQQSVFGYITGSPGIGKSIGAYSNLLKLHEQGWVVTWIHLSSFTPPFCVHFYNGYKYTRMIDPFKNDIERVLYYFNEKKHIVFLDGYTSFDHFNKYIMECTGWLRHNKQLRRLVLVCSMITWNEIKMDDILFFKIKEFFMNPWKIEDYYNAIKSNEFFESVKDKLDSSNFLDIERNELIDSKYYFSGGNVRNMFGYNTDCNIKNLNSSIESVYDIIPIIQTIRHEYPIVNELFSTRKKYRNKSRAIVSEYASSQFSLRVDQEYIKKIIQALKYETSMNSWILEMWFIATLKEKGVMVNYEITRYRSWKSLKIELFDPIRMNQEIFEKTPKYLKPLKWNLGGYDLIYIDEKDKYIGFFQFNRESSNILDLKYFHQFLENIQNLNFKLHSFDIHIIVSNKKTEFHNINNIKNQGLLEKFSNKWKKGKEHEYIKICNIDLS